MFGKEIKKEKRLTEGDVTDLEEVIIRYLCELTKEVWKVTR